MSPVSLGMLRQELEVVARVGQDVRREPTEYLFLRIIFFLEGAFVLSLAVEGEFGLLT